MGGAAGPEGVLALETSSLNNSQTLNTALLPASSLLCALGQVAFPL